MRPRQDRERQVERDITATGSQSQEPQLRKPRQALDRPRREPALDAEQQAARTGPVDGGGQHARAERSHVEDQGGIVEPGRSELDPEPLERHPMEQFIRALELRPDDGVGAADRLEGKRCVQSRPAHVVQEIGREGNGRMAPIPVSLPAVASSAAMAVAGPRGDAPSVRPKLPVADGRARMQPTPHRNQPSMNTQANERQAAEIIGDTVPSFALPNAVCIGRSDFAASAFNLAAKSFVGTISLAVENCGRVWGERSRRWRISAFFFLGV